MCMSFRLTICVYISDDDSADVVSNYFKKKSKRLGLLSFLKSAQDNILPQGGKKGY